jgi:hypothetical protein
MFTASADKPVAKTTEKPAQKPEFSLYFVVPADTGKFSTKYNDSKRAKLGIYGPFIAGWQGKYDGYFTWVTNNKADQLKNLQAIKSVVKVSAENKHVNGSPTKNLKKLNIGLAPNDWKVKPPASTYKNMQTIFKELSNSFDKYKNVSVAYYPKKKQIIIDFKNGPVEQGVIESLKKMPQVYNLSWAVEADWLL